MTNAEKFKEVFGFELCYGGKSYDYCIGEYSEVCKQRASCRGCPCEDWGNQEYKNPCCGNCKHHVFEDVDLGLCCNDESDHLADWTEYDDCCECWEGRG